jgi:hypothetical protein
VRVGTKYLTGYIGPDRFTMTQQSVLAGFTHAVQLELSLTLRKCLSQPDERGRRALRAMANAVVEAWAGSFEAEVERSCAGDGSIGD